MQAHGRALDPQRGADQGLARIESLTDAAAAPKGALSIAAEGATFAIPLEGIIDIAAEKARLVKALEKLRKRNRRLAGAARQPQIHCLAKERWWTRPAPISLPAARSRAGRSRRRPTGRNRLIHLDP